MQVSRQLVTGSLGAVLFLCGAQSWATEVYRDNVVIVLDASGSMGTPMSSTGVAKMDAAKMALNEVLKQADDTTQVGLLVFSSKNAKNDWVYPLGPLDPAALQRAIALPVPGGGTPLGRYMKIAADRLLQERERQYGYGTYRLLVVTDGAAQDQDMVTRHTTEIMARGITTDVIGVDMRESHILATKAHSYRKADDPDSLKRAIADVFAEVSATATDDAASDAFDIVAPLPFEVATGMIKALASSGNSPIGGPAKNARRSAPRARQQATAPPPRSTNPPTGGRPARSQGSMSLMKIAVGVLILLLVLRGIFKAKRADR